MGKIVQAKKNDPPAADEVFPNLLIGNKAAAEAVDFLNAKKITHVVNLAAVSSTKFIVRPNKSALRRNKIRLTDLKLRPNQKFDEHFETSGELIEQSLQSGCRVLVNCWQGASRSATVVLAYLIGYQDSGGGGGAQDGERKERHPPNNKFLQSLVDYEEMKVKTTRAKG
eukprot:TRINITY_DN15205_c0_g1_i2.p1 TRINITY_DN15205_c0_g1~~TRINITY_DN15205_c0_g1_i2.p1  ORF type:complete len:181 (-),score=49.49 TRINITY_DN15205_c0_g1_i2:84-590(-)